MGSGPLLQEMEKKKMSGMLRGVERHCSGCNWGSLEKVVLDNCDFQRRVCGGSGGDGAGGGSLEELIQKL